MADRAKTKTKVAVRTINKTKVGVTVGFSGLTMALAIIFLGAYYLVPGERPLLFTDQSTWVVESISQGPNPPWFDFSVDGKDQSWVSFFEETEGVLKINRRQSNGWETMATSAEFAAGDVAPRSGMAVDENGQPMIAYFEKNPDRLFLARYLRGQWIRSEIVEISADSNIELFYRDGKYQTVILTQSEVDNDVIHLAKWENGMENWHVELAQSRPEIGENFAAGLSDGNEMVVVFIDEQTGELGYVREVEKELGTGPLLADQTEGFKIENPALFINLNQFYVSYFEASSNRLAMGQGELTAEGMALNKIDEVAEGDDQPGIFSSVAFSPSGKMWLAVYQGRPGDLWLAEGTDSGLRSYLVDNRGNVGAYPRLKVNQAGHPEVVYFDQDERQIKFACIGCAVK